MWTIYTGLTGTVPSSSVNFDCDTSLPPTPEIISQFSHRKIPTNPVVLAAISAGIPLTTPEPSETQQAIASIHSFIVYYAEAAWVKNTHEKHTKSQITLLGPTQEEITSEASQEVTIDLDEPQITLIEYEPDPTARKKLLGQPNIQLNRHPSLQ